MFKALARRAGRKFDNVAWAEVERRLGVHRRVNRIYAQHAESGTQGCVTLSDRFLAYQPNGLSGLLVMDLSKLKCALLLSPVFAVGSTDGKSFVFNVSVQGQGIETDEAIWRPFWRDLIDACEEVPFSRDPDEYNAAFNA